MKIKLKPFTVPNYVLMETPAKPRQEALTETPKFSLDEIPVQDLDELCTNFRREVFFKAKKNDPREGRTQG